jgi:hypothetical protein
VSEKEASKKPNMVFKPYLVVHEVVGNVELGMRNLLISDFGFQIADFGLRPLRAVGSRLYEPEARGAIGLRPGGKAERIGHGA